MFGASGYAGAELLRLIAGHPSLEVELATADSQAGGRIAELYPSLAPAYPDQVLTTADPAAADGLDLKQMEPAEIDALWNQAKVKLARK